MNNEKFDDEYVFFYVHKPCVIIGKFQNAQSEVDLKYLEKNGITLARRISGGGAVYHDEGNLNFSFICRKKAEGIDFEPYLTPVVNALRKMELDVSLSGRNDLLIDGRKFGGNAQHVAGEKVLCHGTIMVNVDIENMTRSLNVDPEKYMSKGIASVRSRVANLADYSTDAISVEKVKESILKELSEGEKTEEYFLSEDDMTAVEKLVAEKFSTWKYNFGGRASFSVTKKKKLPAGLIEIAFDAKEGMITDIKITGDFFSEDDISVLEKALVGVRLRKDDIILAISGKNVISGVSSDELAEIILY